MRSLAFKVVGGVVGGALLLGFWVFFAPTKVGGSTTYSVTSGISMEPLLHKNDLAFVRSEPSYHVGDIVLYQSQVVGKPVLHRIILIQNGNYFFQGDNNSFVDPGYATKSQLTGTLWFHIPKVGVALSWLGAPVHAALLAGLAVMIIALTGSTTKSRRRRRRGSKKMTPKAVPPQRSDPRTHAGRDDVGDAPARDPSRRRPPTYLEGPMSTLMAMGVAVALAIVFLGVGFSRPLQVTGVLPDAFSQAGTFSYSAAAKTATAVYPSGLVQTGDPIYPSLVDVVNMRFGYQFTSTLPHRIKGTIELRALVLSKTDTWQELSTVAPSTDFVGDKASATTDLSLASLYTLIDSVSSDSGVAGTNYSVDIQPVVHVTGTVDGHPIDQKFSPVLPFAVATSSIRVDVAVAPPPPGATYVPSSAATALQAALHPAQPGSVPHLVTNEVSLAKYKVPVSKLRAFGIALSVLALVMALVHDRRRRKGVKRSEEELIAKKVHALIVPVAALGPSAGHAPVAVPDFAHLAGLAQFLERPILYEVRDGNRTYAVDDETRRYFTTAVDRRAPRAPGATAADRIDAGANDTSASANDASETSDPRPKDESGSRRAGAGDASAEPADLHWRPEPLAVTPPVGDSIPRITRAHRRQLSNSAPTRRRPKGATVARIGAGVFVLAVIATLTVSFTASTTVPPSRVGRSVVAGQVTQAAPAGCSALPLVNLVFAAGTFSTTQPNSLILGTSGVDTISATGTGNCIMGGAGKDKVTSTAGSVCIVGPTAGSTYANCTNKAK